MSSILHARNLSVAYGDAVALWNVSLSIDPGELVAVVGPNGAGKTTLVNALMRILPIRSGHLYLSDAEVTHVDAQAMCDQGVSIIPEGRKLFVNMSVEENLDIGAYRTGARATAARTKEQVFELFPILKDRRWQQAGTLSGGQQQMVAIGRALMAQPRLLLIDEPSLGLAPSVVDQVFEAIERIHRSGVSMLLIEQNVSRALAVANRAYVLEGGRVVTEGLARELMTQPHIRQAYLGESSGTAA
jgi:branched-chain amino acid transport system ATP-binding protein